MAVTVSSFCRGKDVTHLSIVRAFIGICSVFLLTSVVLQRNMHSADDNRRHRNNKPFWVRRNINNNALSKDSTRWKRSQVMSRWNRVVDANNDTISTRLLFEMDHPPNDMVRIQAHAAKQRSFHSFASPPNMAYDIFNCPDEPPPSYPMTWNVIDVIRNWNPDDVELTDWPNQLYQGLCLFDWNTDRRKAETYRQAELPFVLQNHPGLLRTSERWTMPGYLTELIGPQVSELADHSPNNHFMFWRFQRKVKLPKGYQRPTDVVPMTFDQWEAKANLMQSQRNQTIKDHWYFRLNGIYDEKSEDQVRPYLYDELPIFVPKKSFFMVDPTAELGLYCLFGMKGIISEAHHDGSRNFIVLLGGQRRYIIAHPGECSNMELFPIHHPSARQSSVDWSTRLSNQRELARFRLEHPKFCDAQVNEVVLQAGDALYLPTFWFHYIVSLNMNFQCNARSGSTSENSQVMQMCGQ